MKNKREYKRYSVKCNGDITDNSFQNYRFIMNDISAGGMNITTDKEIKDENTLSIYFDILGVLLPRATQIKGRVVRKNEDTAVYSYGIRFYNLTNMEIIEIDEYLRFRHYSSLVHMVENPVEDTDSRFASFARLEL